MLQAKSNIDLDRETIETEYKAAIDGVAVIDRSEHGRIEIEGADALGLLHRLSTNDLMLAAAGDLVGTVLTTEKGRIIDYVKVLVRNTHLLVMTSPGNADTVINWVSKYCIMDDVRCVNVTSSTSMYSLVGPLAPSVFSELFGVSLSEGKSTEVQVPWGDVTAFWDHDFDTDIVNLVVAVAQSESLRGLLAQQVPQMGKLSFDAFRISRGIPSLGGELSDAFNPYDVGLRHAISFTKGCYIGQEVIARLDTYEKIRQTLKGIAFSQEPLARAPNAVLYKDTEKVGWCTSLSTMPIQGKFLGLGVLTIASVQSGDSVQLRSRNSNVIGIVKNLPMTLDTNA